MKYTFSNVIREIQTIDADFKTFSATWEGKSWFVAMECHKYGALYLMYNMDDEVLKFSAKGYNGKTRASVTMRFNGQCYYYGGPKKVRTIADGTKWSCFTEMVIRRVKDPRDQSALRSIFITTMHQAGRQVMEYVFGIKDNMISASKFFKYKKYKSGKEFFKSLGVTSKAVMKELTKEMEARAASYHHVQGVTDNMVKNAKAFGIDHFRKMREGNVVDTDAYALKGLYSPQRILKVARDGWRGRDAVRMVSLVVNEDRWDRIPENYRQPPKKPNATDLHHWGLIALKFIDQTNQELPVAWAKTLPKTFLNYTVHIPKESVELVEWGARHSHCVGMYDDRVINGYSYIFALKESDELTWTVEVNPRTNFIVQAMGPHNLPMDSNLRSVLQSWITKHMPVPRTNDRRFEAWEERL